MNTKKLLLSILVISLSSMYPRLYAQESNQVKKINVTNFTVKPDRKGISINWVTDNAIETNYFEIQKSSDGVNFKTIALVLGPDPGNDKANCYGCFDNLVNKSKHCYYRLKHIDFNGIEQLSETKLLARS